MSSHNENFISENNSVKHISFNVPSSQYNHELIETIEKLSKLENAKGRYFWIHSL